MNNANQDTRRTTRAGDTPAGYEGYQLLCFSKLLNRRIRLDKTNRKNGRLTDLVFRLSEPYPEAVGIYIEHGKGYPSELIPWEKVARIEEEAILVTPAEGGAPYPRFVDQKGWILLNEHLMGQTILDIDGRRTEVVNDVDLLYSKGRMIVVHVDVSFNGFLRKWGLDRFVSGKDQLISWRYVQPLSVEDHTKDVVTLSVAREQALELPGEDLADALEVLSGDEQQAMFAALAPDKAAEVLVEAEPRAKRQLIAFLRDEKARLVLDKMSVPQIASLLSDLPHQKSSEMLKLLSPARAERAQAVMANTDVLASTLMGKRFLAFARETRVGEVLRTLRTATRDHRNIFYFYVVAGPEQTLLGVVDLRDLVTASEDAALGDLMISPVVTAPEDALREDLVALFARYQFRMLPVVNPQDHLLGIVRYRDIMRGATIEFPN
ncbi:MAG TPA: CBS domain-containing protein [Candidatus Binatia bacterium]|jgi:magnesium transporter|nr:CBS domain-containing protein [Candidatus Binatia bacterium]